MEDAVACEFDGVEHQLYDLIRGVISCYIFDGTEPARAFLQCGCEWAAMDIKAYAPLDDGIRRCAKVLEVLGKITEEEK